MTGTADQCTLLHSVFPALNTSDCCTLQQPMIQCSPQPANLITHLYLNNTQINTRLSDQISALTHLVVLNLANTSLFGDIPTSIIHITSLNVLDLSSNPYLSGTIPLGIDLLPIHDLHLQSTNLTGEIPSLPIGLDQCQLPAQSQFVCAQDRTSTHPCTFADKQPRRLQGCAAVSHYERRVSSETVSFLSTVVMPVMLLMAGVGFVVWYKLRRRVRYTDLKYGYNPYSKTELGELRLEPAFKLTTDLSGCLVYQMNLGSRVYADSSAVLLAAHTWRVLFEDLGACVKRIRAHYPELLSVALTNTLSECMIEFITSVLTSELCSVLNATENLYDQLHSQLIRVLDQDPAISVYVDTRIDRVLNNLNHTLNTSIASMFVSPFLVSAIRTFTGIKRSKPMCALVSVQPNANFVVDVMNTGTELQHGIVALCLFPGIIDARTNLVLERARVKLVETAPCTI